jgi:Protein of unknown function (DUF3223)
MRLARQSRSLTPPNCAGYSSAIPKQQRKSVLGLHISRQENPPYNSRGFHIHRVDGTRTDFSYLTCVNGRPSPVAEVISAMRAEVAEDIWQTKLSYFAEHADDDDKVPCAEAGRLITLAEAHADHAEPFRFAVLATTFLEARGIVPDLDLIKEVNFQRRFRDRALALDWRAFHHKLARIRIVDAAVNLKDGHRSKPKSAVWLKLEPQDA